LPALGRTRGRHESLIRRVRRRAKIEEKREKKDTAKFEVDNGPEGDQAKGTKIGLEKRALWGK